MSGLFFTGTDTGVGKTFVLAAVARVLRAAGCEVVVVKPLATGSSEDTRLLREAAGLPAGQGYEDRITPWRFAAEAAPTVAARLEQRRLDLDDIVAAVRRQQQQGRRLLVEGIGGLFCPLTETA